MDDKTKTTLDTLKVKYINAFADKIMNIRKCISNKDVGSVQQEFHKFKGSGKIYGFAEVSDIAIIIDRQCKANHPMALENAEKACLLFEKIKFAFENKSNFDIKQDPLFSEIQ